MWRLCKQMCDPEALCLCVAAVSTAPVFSAARNTSVQLFVLLGTELSCRGFHKAVFFCLSF